MYMDDIRINAQNENELETLAQPMKIIQPGYEI